MNSFRQIYPPGISISRLVSTYAWLSSGLLWEMAGWQHFFMLQLWGTCNQSLRVNFYFSWSVRGMLRLCPPYFLPYLHPRTDPDCTTLAEGWPSTGGVTLPAESWRWEPLTPRSGDESPGTGKAPSSPEAPPSFGALWLVLLQEDSLDLKGTEGSYRGERSSWFIAVGGSLPGDFSQTSAPPVQSGDLPT